MIEEQPTISPPVMDPPDPAPKPTQSIGDKLSYFADYIETYPSRVPLGTIKSFGLVGVMVFGSLAGVMLLKNNLDTRNQASEGNKFVAVCKLKDVTKMATQPVVNSTSCLLNGSTYYACNDGYTYKNKECVKNSPAK